VTSEDAVVKDWKSLKPWEQAIAWQKASPGMAERVAAIAEAELRHERRLAWAKYAKELIGYVIWFGAVVFLGVVAWHYADKHAGPYGLAILGSGVIGSTGGLLLGRHTAYSDRQVSRKGKGAKD
jgi:hypothetical protein